ncbi:MAG: RloB domain-containing protein [Lachnospiraceae bacterium]|nr:RloB domain-containing protein [Lachnospiraceae bacterium]
MINKYRLSASIFEREEEKDKIKPQKIYFLSVEGNLTEKEYFEGVSANRKILGINALVNVEVLKRSNKDTNSAPKQVIELLEEYMRLRETSRHNLIEDIPEELIEKYGTVFIQTYLNSPEEIPKKEKNIFENELTKIGYNISYRKYLHQYQNKYDEFAILIDRDAQNHSEKNISESLEYCKSKGYKCYISNPCFEFWLLLHVSDIFQEYNDKLDIIKENARISRHNTFISKELSDKVHHGKSKINFKTNYLPNIDLAIERAKKFACEENDLVNKIGSNIWKLFESMRNFNPKDI